MAKRDRTLEALDALAAAVEDDPRSAAATKALTRALRARSNLVVEAALALIYEHELDGFVDALEAAWAKAMDEPVKHDPGCRTKVGVVKALDALREPEDELFMAAARHVQREPVWGGTQDTAAGLRAVAAVALVNRSHPDAMIELARLLADPERVVRQTAADAVACSGDVLVGIPLLTLRVCAGEPEPEVLSACLAALLSLDAEQTFAFVAERLHARDEGVVEAAALALGQERPAGALSALREVVDQRFGDTRKIALLAIAMLRSDDAWTYLLEQIATAGFARAAEAINALAPYREHPELRERVLAAINSREREREQLTTALDEAFD